MTREQGRVVAIAFVVLAFIVGRLMSPSTAATFDLSPQILEVLGIISGVIAIVTNYLPSVWRTNPPDNPSMPPTPPQ